MKQDPRVFNRHNLIQNKFLHHQEYSDEKQIPEGRVNISRSM